MMFDSHFTDRSKVLSDKKANGGFGQEQDLLEPIAEQRRLCHQWPVVASCWSYPDLFLIIYRDVLCR